MPDQQCWSFIYHLDGRQTPNESLPEKDVFYSLNVILGLASLGEDNWRNDYDLPALLQKNAARMFEVDAPVYALGTALWAAAELDIQLDPIVLKKIETFIKNQENWINLSAQAAGMILTGLSEQKAKGNNSFDLEATALFHFIEKNYLSGSGLFFDRPTGIRRYFSSFATQTYLTNACYHYGLRYNNDRALVIADSAVRKLISLQGQNGEWPWFYYPQKGIVVDNYEIYSVHQIGMAALFLEFAEKRGIAGAREATIKSFDWIFGRNQLHKIMTVPELGMFYRSIIRKNELQDKLPRIRRSIINGLSGRADPYEAPENLALRLECRSYELGWVLYSFGTRTDLPEIINHPAFNGGNIIIMSEPKIFATL
jgi:hypothetical protein